MPRPTDHWNAPSIALHWLVALLVFAVAALGLGMTELPNTPTKVQVYTLHKSLGLSVLALTALRLAWRRWAGAPSPIAGTPRWQRRLAAVSHAVLYALCFAVPLSGWAYNSAANFPLRWFGILRLPALVDADPAAKPLWKAVHEGAVAALAMLVLLHAAAAFKHHYLDRDATLRRMLPRRRRRSRDRASA